MISIPLSRLPTANRATLELSDDEACALVRDLVLKLPPNQRGKLLSALDSLHRRESESQRDG